MEIIRVTTQDQLQNCSKVRFNVFVDEQQVPEHLEMDEKDESPEACHHFLIIDEGQAVAAARWYEHQPQTAKLQRVAVLKEYRGRSLGKQIIPWSSKLAKCIVHMPSLMRSVKQRAFTTNWDTRLSPMSLSMMPEFCM
jgi:predicted GNAT family N-acyltransferase